MCTHTHKHIHTTTTMAGTQTHSSLFSDKGLLLQLCHDFTKDFFSRKRGLNRDLVGDWGEKALTLFSFAFLPLTQSPSLSLPLSLSSLLNLVFLYPSLTSSRGAVHWWEGSPLTLCSGVPLYVRCAEVEPVSCVGWWSECRSFRGDRDSVRGREQPRWCLSGRVWSVHIGENAVCFHGSFFFSFCAVVMVRVCLTGIHDLLLSFKQLIVQSRPLQ